MLILIVPDAYHKGKESKANQGHVKQGNASDTYVLNRRFWSNNRSTSVRTRWKKGKDGQNEGRGGV